MNELSQDQKIFLLRLARQAIEHYLKTGKYLKIEIDDPVLKEKKGAFVTLKTRGQLRGCIGYPLPYKSLVETIIEMAVAAATQDFRFSPLRIEELPDTLIEISVLSLPQPIQNIKEIRVGQHGIIVSKGQAKGLLLPQVPVEYNWDLETYLAHGCLKAGLDPNCWQKGAKIEIFEAEIFSEEELSSAVKA
ncbi:MAG: AmmeMemoRadiSam system protein A [Candidatus Aminicenantes bacterium]|nr:AmmeMemoRadiSam system protein A [Candidatus Aminicenantes bacterium]